MSNTEVWLDELCVCYSLLVEKLHRSI